MASVPFRFLRNLNRSREIATVLLNYGFQDLVDRSGLRKYLRWGRRLIFRRKMEPPVELTRGQRVRMALQDLGPTFVKFGQILSTRADLMPEDLVSELSLLQEQVRPFAGDVAISLLEQEFSRPITELFAEFSREPVAAGSLGQVHRARRHSGQIVAVKIRRPNVVREVERDLTLMHELAVLAAGTISEFAIIDPVGLVDQFSRSIRREMNFVREGRTLDEFARLFHDDATLYVPRVEWDLTRESVLTMEYIDGIRVTDQLQLIQAQIRPVDVAFNGARIFLKQALEFGYFHGDPHPGNLRVLPDGTLVLLDYGMIGRIEDDRRERLIDLFLAIVRQDVRSAVDLILLLGKPIEAVDRPLLVADVRDFVETYYGVSLERIHVGRMLGDFVAILSRHTIRYPSDLMLLIRALVTLEGVGRTLDPEFNLALHLPPFIHRIVRDRYHPRRLWNRWSSASYSLMNAMHGIPLHLERTLEKLAQDDLKVQLDYRNLDYLVTELDRTGNRLVIGIIVSALILASALIVRTGSSWNFNLVTVGIFVLSSLLGVWLIYGIFRSGRL